MPGEHWMKAMCGPPGFGAIFIWHRERSGSCGSGGTILTITGL